MMGGVNSRKVRFVTLAASAVAAVGVVPLLAGCATERAEADGSPRETAPVAQAAEPEESVLVLGSADAAELALTASQTFFTTAPVVVLAAADDEAAQATAAAAAAPLTAPVLLVGGGISDDGVRAELERLGAVAVVTVDEDQPPPGGAASEDAPDERPSLALGGLGDVAAVHLDVDAVTETGEVDPRDLEDVLAELPESGEADVLTEVLVLAQPGATQVAAVATARAAGALPVEVADGDPLADAGVVETISAAKALAVVGIGEAFGTSEALGWRVRAAESGVLLPSGSQLALPDDVRYVVTAADAVTPALLAVGEPATTDTLARATTAADAFTAADERSAVPTVEVRATHASSTAGPDGDYSTEAPAAELRPFVDAAAEAGVQVVLTLEPGLATFDEQVEEYADLLALPGVGVALDVSARFGAGQDGTGADGTVDVAEVEAAQAALAEIVRSEGLPQKLLVVQAEGPDTVRGLADLDAGDGEVAVVVQSVAPGGFAARVAAWEALPELLPAGAVAGWTTGSSDPTRDVAGVLALEPAPRYVAAMA